MNGHTSHDAFHNILRDLSAQARAETGMPLVKRLPLVAADPFKDWSIPQGTPSASPAESQPPLQPMPVAIPALPALPGGVKRPAVNVLNAPSSTKEPRISPVSSYYATMYVARNETEDNDQAADKIVCQVW